MNNSATTRIISKIALEYNGNDKGMAELAAVNFLLSSNPEDQFHEMKIRVMFKLKIFNNLQRKQIGKL